MSIVLSGLTAIVHCTNLPLLSFHAGGEAYRNHGTASPQIFMKKVSLWGKGVGWW